MKTEPLSNQELLAAIEFAETKSRTYNDDSPMHALFTEQLTYLLLIQRERSGQDMSHPCISSDDSGAEFRRPAQDLRDGRGNLVSTVYGDWQVKIEIIEPSPRPYLAAVRIDGRLFVPCINDHDQAQLDKEWNTGKLE